MKVTDLNNFIQDIVTNEVKKHIIKEAEENKTDVFHVTCEGEPVSSHKTEEEASQHKQFLEKTHPDKSFIIEKESYESHDHMLDELDAMGEKLEKLEKQKSMEEMLKGNQGKLDKNDNGKVDSQDFEILRGETNEEYGCESCDQGSGIFEEEPQEFHAKVCNECGGEINEEDMCNECGAMYEEKGHDHSEHGGEEEDLIFSGHHSEEEGHHACHECGGELDEEYQCTECGKMHGMEETHTDLSQDEHGLGNTIKGVVHPDDMKETQMCNECGGMMNEHGMCNECGYMMESKKKKTIRLTETEMVKLIKKIVKESTPGIPGVAITKKNRDASGNENDEHIKATEKKMKDYLSFDGNDNSEFPHQNGVNTKKMARTNSEEQDEEVKRNFAGLENLEYDVEPSEGFKKRLKMSIEGDSKMGNGPVTPKPSIKPSNGADKGKESKEKSGSSIPTPETGKKIEKQVKNREEDKKKRVLYPKEAVPMSESKVSFSNVLQEEMNKMKNLLNYNKRTQ